MFVIYTLCTPTRATPKTDIAKLFQNGRSQAVRRPWEFRVEGDRVRIRRVAEGYSWNRLSRIRRSGSKDSMN